MSDSPLIVIPGRKNGNPNVPSFARKGNPELAQFLTQCGHAFFNAGHLGQAARAYSHATEAYGGALEAENNLGRIALKMGRLKEAADHFLNVMRMVPENYGTLVNMAILRSREKRFDLALGFAERAIEAGRKADCLNSEPYYVIAGLYSEQDMTLEEAIILEQGLQLFPGDPHLTDARSAWNLLHRNWEAGWADYEARGAKLQAFPDLDDAPHWEGEPLGTKSLIIIAEQGMGDQIMFSRYVHEVRRRNPHAVLTYYSRPELARLMDGLPVDNLIASDREFNSIPINPWEKANEQLFDLWVSVASLPHYLGTGAPPPCVKIQPKAHDVERFRQLIPDNGRLRVGLCWSGNPLHERDCYRSMEFEQIKPLLDVESCDFYSLQHNADASDPRMVDLTAFCHDMADTAAAIECLDLVISVDTSVAHLAGVIDKPVWLISYRPWDWRWGMKAPEGEVSHWNAWYASLVVFRQDEALKWEPVVQEIAESLEHFQVRHRNRLRGQPAKATDNISDSGYTEPYKISSVSPNPVVTMPCRYGEMSFHRTDRWLGRSLELYGEWSESEADLFRRIITPGSFVVEAGANIGALTLPIIRHLGPTGRILAFEPQGEIFDLLLLNVLLRPGAPWAKPDGSPELAKSEVLRMALGAQPATIRIPAPDYSRGICNPGGFELVEAEGGNEVEVRTLDSFELDRLDFLKADVEGQEIQVLMGAEATINRCRPLIFVEDDRQENSAALHAWLTAHGYRMYRHLAPLYNPVNFRGYRVNVFANTVSIDLLCVPKDRHDLKHLTDLMERVR